VTVTVFPTAPGFEKFPPGAAGVEEPGAEAAGVPPLGIGEVFWEFRIEGPRLWLPPRIEPRGFDPPDPPRRLARGLLPEPPLWARLPRALVRGLLFWLEEDPPRTFPRML